MTDPVTVTDILETPGTRCAVVVAHPDDETMWFGGMMITCPVEWTVFCCSIPRRDPERAWHFHDACEELGATPRLMPYVEPDPTSRDMPWLSQLELGGYALVATHNAVGEYGHQHHIAVHDAVVGKFQRDVYHRDPPIIISTCYGMPEVAPDIYIPLRGDLMELKKSVLRCYRGRSSSDGGQEKHEALMRVYGDRFDLAQETYRIER